MSPNAPFGVNLPPEGGVFVYAVVGGIRHPLPHLAPGDRPAIRHPTFGDILGEVESVERDANGWVISGWACGKGEQGRQAEVPSTPSNHIS